MPRRTLATPLFDELAQRLALRRAPRTSDPETAEIPGRLPDARNGRTAAPEPTVGTLFHLVSLVVVVTVTVAVFYGIGFVLLAHPREEMIADAGDRGVEVEPRRSDLFPLPGTDDPPLPIQTELPHPATASAYPAPSAQAPEAREVRPPENNDTTWGRPLASPAHKVAASAIAGASFSREVPASRSTGADATLIPPAGISPNKTRAGVGRHHHEGTRKHWTVLARP